MIEYDDGVFGEESRPAEEYYIESHEPNQPRPPPIEPPHPKRAKRKKKKVWFLGRNSRQNKRLLVHSKLSPSVYKAFIDVAIGRLDLGKEETNIKKVIRSLMNTGELCVVKGVDHEILGHMDYAIIHLPTHRLVLHAEHRVQIVDYCVQRYVGEPDPVGASIGYIEDNFFGFGDEIRVRFIDVRNCLVLGS